MLALRVNLHEICFMLDLIRLQNFRQFTDTTITPLNRINLFVGQNNSGKTALLEALYLLFADQAHLLHLPSAFRIAHNNDQDNYENYWKWLFKNQYIHNKFIINASNKTLEIDFSGQELNSSENLQLLTRAKTNRSTYPETIRCRINSNGVHLSNNSTKPFFKISAFNSFGLPATRAVNSAADVEEFNQLVLIKDGKKRLIDILKSIEPALTDLQYSKIGNQPFLYADVGLERFVPVSQMGQGFNRLLRIFADTLLGNSQILIIDEIENGIGFRGLHDVWQGLSTLAIKNNVQIFATTHSYECIQAAHDALSKQGTLSHFALHRLSRRGDNIAATTYDQETLEAALQAELEVR